ncbi:MULTISPECIES: hypothetical protein [Phyllobacteriaceae]|uniref:hypothetical protein n=1 Tax=Phyllobacteriaceae TaxID=69277 RepID=UPI002ACAA76B|nr:hypothetical protein [Chelativorans sp. M5D2P16]MDZ5699343.1 hypothetical protein [Chelativorans sp. M5D2P16]
MADTKTLTDHDAIRDWAAARAGQPALSDPAQGMSEAEPVLCFAFGQHAYQDTDQGWDEIGEVDIIEWDEWFRIFEERQLALVVSEDVPGQREEFHQFVRRP